MLAEQIKKLENDNARLLEILRLRTENIPKPKECRDCKHYRQHYCKDEFGTYFKVYAGHCICKVSTKKRKGKKEPTPEDTCLCFQERIWKG